MELWSSRTPETGTIERQVERAEEQGWTGVTFTDSQNLVGDPFVAVTLASRVSERLRFATSVSNLATRHPAALAGTAITVNEETGGRFTLGVGRGDTAQFHLGRKPMPVAPFADRLRQVQGFLRGEVVDLDGHPSEMRWLPRTKQSKVLLDVAAFTHSSAMPGSTGAGLRDEDRAVAAEIGARYDSNVHLQNAAEHTGALAPDFVNRFVATEVLPALVG